MHSWFCRCTRSKPLHDIDPLQLGSDTTLQNPSSQKWEKMVRQGRSYRYRREEMGKIMAVLFVSRWCNCSLTAETNLHEALQEHEVFPPLCDILSHHVGKIAVCGAQTVRRNRTIFSLWKLRHLVYLGINFIVLYPKQKTASEKRKQDCCGSAEEDLCSFFPVEEPEVSSLTEDEDPLPGEATLELLNNTTETGFRARRT